MSTAKLSPETTLTVSVKCVGCKDVRDISPESIDPEVGVAICPTCFMPCVVTKAKVRRG